MDIYKFLNDHDIRFTRYDHAPVFTVEDVKHHVPPLPARRTKNLFLRDNKGKRHFLLIVNDDKMVDLKALPSTLGISKLSFGSPARLRNYLGVDPGSVSVLAIANDLNHKVDIIIDELWNKLESGQVRYGLNVDVGTLLAIE